MTFGERLRQLRMSRYLTQKQLAEALDLSQTGIASYENNMREPSFKIIQRFADFFGVPMSSMLPTDNSAEQEFAQQMADAFKLNPKLVTLFKLTRDMNDTGLNAVITVAKAIAKRD